MSPWPRGRPVSERDLACARMQVAGMVESGIAGDEDEADDILLDVGEVGPHAHARLLTQAGRQERYGS